MLNVTSAVASLVSTITTQWTVGSILLGMCENNVCSVFLYICTASSCLCLSKPQCTYLCNTTYIRYGTLIDNATALYTIYETHNAQGLSKSSNHGQLHNTLLLKLRIDASTNDFHFLADSAVRVPYGVDRFDPHTH